MFHFKVGIHWTGTPRIDFRSLLLVVLFSRGLSNILPLARIQGEKSIIKSNSNKDNNKPVISIANNSLDYGRIREGRLGRLLPWVEKRKSFNSKSLVAHLLWGRHRYHTLENLKRLGNYLLNDKQMSR